MQSHISSSRLSASLSRPARHTILSPSRAHWRLNDVLPASPAPPITAHAEEKVNVRLLRPCDLEGSPMPTPFLQLTAAQVKSIVQQKEGGFTLIPFEELPRNALDQVNMYFPCLDDVPLKDGGTYIVARLDMVPPLKSEVAFVIDGSRLRLFKLLQPFQEAFGVATRLGSEIFSWDNAAPVFLASCGLIMLCPLIWHLRAD